MPDIDLKFTYHGFNREDGEYCLHQWRTQWVGGFYARAFLRAVFI